MTLTPDLRILKWATVLIEIQDGDMDSALEGVNMKSNWLYYGLVLLTIEKIIQHVAVTLAFYFDWMGIGSTVAVPPRLLMVLGAIVAILFMISLGGLLKKRAWSINLLIALAVFDMLGEFAAQGRLAIQLNVSFLAATLLLILSLVYGRQIRRKPIEEGVPVVKT
jgi:hypothetical protein